MVARNSGLRALLETGRGLLGPLRGRLDATTLAWALLAVIASAPAWIVKYPPIQDLPIHVACTRVVHSIHDPSFGLDEHFVLTLGRTQYVFYYVIASFLTYFMGVFAANIALMCLYLGGTPLALRSLLNALGKDERLAILVVPLLANVMFMLGLLPFVLGIPIMFWALATAVRHFEHPTPQRGVLLAVLAVALFYSHVFPFCIFGLGFAAMFPWTRPQRWIVSALPVVPALLFLARWTLFTPAGQLTAGALDPALMRGVQPLNSAIPGAFQWLTDNWRDTSDEKPLVATVVVAILVTGLAQGDPDRSRPRARAYALLPIACIFFYFTLGEGHGYIWLISQRFPILCLMCGIPLLRMPMGARGWAATAMALGLALSSTYNTCAHFIRFQLEEVGDFDEALEHMAPKKKVAALIYDKGSAQSNWPSFLHFGSYYQARRGGVIQFTYAGYAHWPFDFREGKYPPPGDGPTRKRWEWTPEQVGIQELYPYYDYVLERGNGFHAPPGTFHVAWRGDRWTVWARD